MTAPVCEYAACNRRADAREDGWLFCATHLLHHRALTHDQPLPRSAPAFPRDAFTQPCGTPAAYRRHLRRGEQACARCIDASTRYRDGYTSNTNGKMWHGVAS